MFKNLALAAISVIAVFSLSMCAQQPDPVPSEERREFIEGASKPLGGGEVRSFARVDASGAPTALGVTLTKAVLDELPQNCKTDTVPGSSSWAICTGGQMNDALITILDAPAEASGTNVRTLELSWLPFGHAPPQVWDHPQFDIHFNFDAPTGGMDESEVYTPPDPAKLPEGYMVLPGSGFPWDTPAQKFHAHSADPKSSPEFSGGPFTTNFLYISYAGNVIGYEPYVALDFLKGLSTTQQIPIRTPQVYPKNGYYPNTMRVGWDEAMDAYVIAVEGFQQYTGANQ